MVNTLQYNDVTDILAFENIKTQGIKYTGSKDKLLPYILKMIYPLHPKKVLDGFSGTTRVSQALAQLGYQVISNDISIWSKIFGYCYLLNKKEKKYYQDIIDYLNHLPGKYEWFSEHYGGSPEKNETKKPWQLHNTMKLDAIREEIDKITNDEIEKSVLLTSLTLALDKVDNTIGHYSAYLRDWAPRSYKTMQLEVPHLILSEEENEVYNEDIFNLLQKKIECDVAYFDPPYGSSNDKMPPSRVRYQAYYHIWKTIILNDKPELFGKTNRRKDSSDNLSYSPFEDFRKNEEGHFIAYNAIAQLIQNTNAEYIVFSYSSGGRVPFSQLLDIFSTYARIETIQKINYQKNVMSNMKWTKEWINDESHQHQEYLFLLKK
ncbi:MAG: hypothetical protein OHK0036_15250 [Bacteroidia bacterium]